MIKTALGLMSGSSLDGLDIAACRFKWQDGRIAHWQLLDGETIPFPEHWQNMLRQLPTADAHTLAKAHAGLGRWMGENVNEFLAFRPQLQPDLVASHGHTIFHFPAEGFTTQIGDGAAIAATTGYTTVSDFRSTDVAMGGQGAPLAPIADRLLFPEYELMLNIGGIANITCNIHGKYIAFDIGGANQILNALAQSIGLPYDDGGRMAASGRLIKPLLEAMDSLPYFHALPPKSLGNDWVQAHQTQVYLAWPASVEDRLHTACIQLARQTAIELARIIETERWRLPHYRILATGGGAFNTFLTKCIIEECCQVAPVALQLPEPGIIAYKEAVLMALMGLLRLAGVPNCISSVTGAQRDTCSGAVYAGWKSKKLMH